LADDDDNVDVSNFRMNPEVAVPIPSGMDNNNHLFA
jgi:hypothetical protein